MKEKKQKPKPEQTQATKISGYHDGKKHDLGKERMDLIEPDFETEMARVLTYGAKMYGEGSWKTIDRAISRYTAALKRHTNRMARGEIIDPSTGLFHAAQIGVNAMFLHYFTTRKEQW